MTPTSARLPALVVCGYLLAASPSFAAHSVTVETLTPALITVGSPVVVTARVRVVLEPTFIQNSLRLLRVADNGGTSSVCVMVDDGTRGDVTPNDGLYACQFTLNETEPRLLAFRASAAYLGEIRRTFSQDVPFPVVSQSTPDSSRATLAQALLQGDVSRAREFLGQALSTAVGQLNASQRGELAAALDACVPVETTTSYQICVDQVRNFRFTLSPNHLNVWRVLVW